MAYQHRGELLQLSTAKMRKLEAESNRILNDHMLTQASETQARIETNVALEENLETRLHLLQQQLNATAEMEKLMHLLNVDVRGSVDMLERNFREFHIDKNRMIQEMHRKASGKLSRFPTESRQTQIEEKTAALFARVRAHRQKDIEICDGVAKEVLEAQQKIEEKRGRLHVLDTANTDHRKRLASLKTEFEETKAMLEQKALQEKEMSVQLEEKKAAIAAKIISSKEEQNEAEMKVADLEAKVVETDEWVADASSKLMHMVKDHAERAIADKEKKRALEELTLTEDIRLELQLTDAKGALQHAHLLHKGARQRLDVMLRKLQQSQGGKSLEEVKQGLDERERVRKEKHEATKKELEEVTALTAELDQQDRERVKKIDAMAENITALMKKEPVLRKELEKVTSQLTKNASECEAASKACVHLEAEVNKLKEDKKRLQNQILAFTEFTTPAKKRDINGESIDLTFSRVSSGDSDVTMASLDVDGISAFSPDTLKKKEDVDQMSSYSYSDQSGAEDNALLNDSLIGDNDSGDEADDKDDGYYLDDSDLGDADEEGGKEQEREADDRGERRAEEDESLFDFSNIGGDSPRMEDDEEDIVSDRNSSNGDGRFPRDIFLNDSPHHDLPRANSPPANLSDIDENDSVLESDTSIQSIWD